MGSNAIFDGAPELPPYLAIASPQHAVRLAAIVAEARKSRKGRLVLDKIGNLVRKGRSVPIVEFIRMSTDGTTPWGWNTILFAKAHLKSPLGLAASVLIHELRHILQEAAGLPKVVELELEAHLDDMRVLMERKVEIKPRVLAFSMVRDIRRKLQGDIDRFFRWFDKEFKGELYPGSLLVDGPDKIVEALKKEKEQKQRQIRLLLKAIEEREGTVRKMKEHGYKRSVVRGYHFDEVANPKDRIRYIREFELPRIKRELRVLQSAEGRKALMAYAENLKRRALLLRKTLLKEG